MLCPRCNSDAYKNGIDKDGRQKYKCKNKECRYDFREGSKQQAAKPRIGMKLDEWRKNFDVDFIVNKVLKSLDKDMIYEKNDICKMTGLRPGYPGLTPTIESQKEYYGKVGSVMYFSHPDTIKNLKEDAKLT